MNRFLSVMKVRGKTLALSEITRGPRGDEMGSPYTGEVLGQFTGHEGQRSRLYAKLGFTGKPGRFTSISRTTRSGVIEFNLLNRKCQSPGQNPGLVAPTPKPCVLSGNPCLVVEPRVTSSPWAGGIWG